MKKAMGIEIGQWLEEKVCEVLDSETKKKIPGRDIMKLRWILAWKEDKGNTDDRKAKARLVVLGFQDPMMGHEEIASPTLNKRSRMLLYQNAVNRGWTVYKADVNAAFLHGETTRGYEVCVGCRRAVWITRISKWGIS